MKHSIFILFCLVFFACKDTVPRAPITVKKSTILKETIEGLKRINELEQKKVIQYTQLDSLRSYQSSPNGYWFSSLNVSNRTSNLPKEGDVAILEYEILDLSNHVIYSKEQLGEKKYKVDKEDFIPALQFGIKQMNVGETVKFVIPSFNAFGVTGDSGNIGINQSIVAIVTLKELINENNNE